MNYEEKYKEALERAKKVKHDIENIGCSMAPDILEVIFPELAESEDERIRKEIVSIVQSYRDSCISEGSHKFDDCLAWLEKQKEIPEKEYVFRPLAGTDITIAAEQAIRRANEGDRLVLAFNGWYVPVDKHATTKGLVDSYDTFIEKQKDLDKMIVVTPEVWDNAINEAYENGKKDNEKQKPELPLMDGDTDTYFDDLRMTTKPLTSRGWFDEGVKYAQRLQKEQKSIIQDVELNDAVYDYVRDHFIAGADFTPEYIKKLMENAFFAGVDYYLLKQESESCESDTNVEKVIEDVIRVYGKTQGEWVGGYDVDTLIVNLRRVFNKKEQKSAEWSEEDERIRKELVEAFEALDIDSSWNGIPVKSILAWLKDQKPAEWSEEDEKIIGRLRSVVNECASYNDALDVNGDYCEGDYAKLDDWLKSLRPSWKPNDEDEVRLINTSISFLKDFADKGYENAVECIDWLKSKLNGNSGK